MRLLLPLTILLLLISSAVMAQVQCGFDLSVVNTESFRELNQDIQGGGRSCGLEFYVGGEGANKSLTGSSSLYSFDSDIAADSSNRICNCSESKYNPSKEEQEKIDSFFEKKVNNAKEKLYAKAARSKFFNLTNKMAALSEYAKNAGGAAGIVAFAPSCNVDHMLGKLYNLKGEPGCDNEVFNRRARDIFGAANKDEALELIRESITKTMDPNIESGKCLTHRAYIDLKANSVPRPFMNDTQDSYRGIERDYESLSSFAENSLSIDTQLLLRKKLSDMEVPWEEFKNLSEEKKKSIRIAAIGKEDDISRTLERQVQRTRSISQMTSNPILDLILSDSVLIKNLDEEYLKPYVERNEIGGDASAAAFGGVGNTADERFDHRLIHFLQNGAATEVKDALFNKDNLIGIAKNLDDECSSFFGGGSSDNRDQTSDLNFGGESSSVRKNHFESLLCKKNLPGPGRNNFRSGVLPEILTGGKDDWIVFEESVDLIKEKYCLSSEGDNHQILSKKSSLEEFFDVGKNYPTQIEADFRKNILGETDEEGKLALKPDFQAYNELTCRTLEKTCDNYPSRECLSNKELKKAKEVIAEKSAGAGSFMGDFSLSDFLNLNDKDDSQLIARLRGFKEDFTASVSRSVVEPQNNCTQDMNVCEVPEEMILNEASARERLVVDGDSDANAKPSNEPQADPTDVFLYGDAETVEQLREHRERIESGDVSINDRVASIQYDDPPDIGGGSPPMGPDNRIRGSDPPPLRDFEPPEGSSDGSSGDSPSDADRISSDPINAPDQGATSIDGAQNIASAPPPSAEPSSGDPEIDRMKDDLRRKIDNMDRGATSDSGSGSGVSSIEEEIERMEEELDKEREERDRVQDRIARQERAQEIRERFGDTKDRWRNEVKDTKRSNRAGNRFAENFGNSDNSQATARSPASRNNSNQNSAPPPSGKDARARNTATNEGEKRAPSGAGSGSGGASGGGASIQGSGGGMSGDGGASAPVTVQDVIGSEDPEELSKLEDPDADKMYVVPYFIPHTVLASTVEGYGGNLEAFVTGFGFEGRRFRTVEYVSEADEYIVRVFDYKPSNKKTRKYVDDNWFRKGLFKKIKKFRDTNGEKFKKKMNSLRKNVVKIDEFRVPGHMGDDFMGDRAIRNTEELSQLQKMYKR